MLDYLKMLKIAEKENVDTLLISDLKRRLRIRKLKNNNDNYNLRLGIYGNNLIIINWTFKFIIINIYVQ